MEQVLRNIKTEVKTEGGCQSKAAPSMELAGFELVLIKEPHRRNLKYRMWLTTQPCTYSPNRYLYFVNYTYGVTYSTHSRIFHDDRIVDDGSAADGPPRSGREKALEFIRSKYEELIDKGYVAPNAVDASSELLAPGEQLYLERKDEYTGERSFLYITRHRTEPIVLRLMGDIGGHGDISEFRLPEEAGDLSALVAEHERMRYRRKKPSAAQLERLHQQCRLRYAFESDDDGDFFDEHMISEDDGDGDGRSNRRGAAKKRAAPSSAASTRPKRRRTANLDDRNDATADTAGEET